MLIPAYYAPQPYQTIARHDYDAAHPQVVPHDTRDLLTAWFVILPMSLASFSTGIIQALGTTWGLLRHYWVVFKLLLTAFATIILLLKLGPISYLAEQATGAASSSTAMAGLRASMVVHGVGGIVVLLIAATLAIYKPTGIVTFGARARQGEEAASRRPDPDGSMPMWVKASLVIIVIALLMLGGMLHLGSHGPAAHMPSHG